MARLAWDLMRLTSELAFGIRVAPVIGLNYRTPRLLSLAFGGIRDDMCVRPSIAEQTFLFFSHQYFIGNLGSAPIRSALAENRHGCDEHQYKFFEFWYG